MDGEALVEIPVYKHKFQRKRLTSVAGLQLNLKNNAGLLGLVWFHFLMAYQPL